MSNKPKAFRKKEQSLDEKLLAINMKAHELAVQMLDMAKFYDADTPEEMHFGSMAGIIYLIHWATISGEKEESLKCLEGFYGVAREMIETLDFECPIFESDWEKF